MTWKSPLSGLPADGQKTVVYYNGGAPSPESMAEILAAHLAELRKADPGVIFGPDINCNEVVMQRLADLHGAGDHVSGLLHGQGGLSIDGEGYTARGLEAALVATARRLGWTLGGMKAVVQGFGAVGAHIGRNLREHGVVLHAVSTIHGALIADTDEGLDAEELFSDWKACRDQGRPSEAFMRFRESPPKGTRFVDKDAIWEERAEIFIPAARTDVLAMPDEAQNGNSDARDVTRFVASTGVRVVVEGANHPVTDEAEHFLESQGVFVLPDYLVNCGGLIGCWADWVYREELKREGQDGKEWLHRLNESALHYVSRIVEQNVPEILAKTRDRPEGMRKAAYELAKERREHLAAKLKAYTKSNGHDHDGRAFARLCMDELLG
jgi:glutamate dehydrogenase/leucine dehydrogenase